MSPEHTNFMHVSPEMRDEFERASGKTSAQLFSSGGFFDRSQKVVIYKPLEEASDRELAAAKKQDSKKHIVYGPNNPSPTARRRKFKDYPGNESLDDASIQGAKGHVSPYRNSKHLRSDNKGKGLRAFFRKPWRASGYRR